MTHVLGVTAPLKCSINVGYYDQEGEIGWWTSLEIKTEIMTAVSVMKISEVPDKSWDFLSPTPRSQRQCHLVFCRATNELSAVWKSCVPVTGGSQFSSLQEHNKPPLTPLQCLSRPGEL